MSQLNAVTGLILSENIAQGNNQSTFIIGKSDYDNLGNAPENGVLLPWLINPAVSWLDYQCWVVSKLDAGIAIHRVLPQQAQKIDQLASGEVFDPAFPNIKDGGPNLQSFGSFTDIKQRMANSRYRFCLTGFAERAGYSIPFPSLKSVAGVPVVPDDKDPQTTVGPYIAHNNSGIPIYYAGWRFWYTVLTPPQTTLAAPPNLAEFATQTATLPQGIQAPVSVPDQFAVQALPQLLNPIRTSK